MALVEYAVALFLALHGLVHLLYVAISQGWIEEEEAMGWNGRSWLLSRLLPEATVLNLGSALYVVVTAGFVVGAIGYLLGTGWATSAIIGASVLSTATILLMWDGSLAKVVDKGLLGVVINLVVIAWLLVL